MKKIIPQISISVLLLSVLIYVVGRWAVRNPIPDDTGDWLLWSGGISAMVLLFCITSGVPLRVRKCITAGTASAIVLLTAAGTWGLFSSAGQKQFPEMAGMIPYCALLLAGILFLLLVIFNLVWRRRLSKHGVTTTQES